MSNSISRRTFLKCTGASVAALGAASLLGGCQQNGSATIVDVKVGDKVTPTSRYSYEGVLLIADVLNHKYTVTEINGDRVVLGDGLNTAFHSKDIKK